MADKFACTHCGFVFEDPDMEVCPRCGTELGQEWDPAELRSFVISELTEKQAKFVATLTTFDADEILAVFRSDGCFALENLTPRQVDAYAEFLKQEGISFITESEEQKSIRLQKQLEAHTASQNAKAAQEQAKANADAKAVAQANAQAENDAKIKAEELARAQMADAEKTKLSSAAQIEADRLRQLELEKIKIETEAKAKIAIAEANAREAEAKLELKKLEKTEQRKKVKLEWLNFLLVKDEWFPFTSSDGYVGAAVPSLLFGFLGLFLAVILPLSLLDLPFPGSLILSILLTVLVFVLSIILASIQRTRLLIALWLLHASCMLILIPTPMDKSVNNGVFKCFCILTYLLYPLLIALLLFGAASIGYYRVWIKAKKVTDAEKKKKSDKKNIIFFPGKPGTEEMVGFVIGTLIGIWILVRGVPWHGLLLIVASSIPALVDMVVRGKFINLGSQVVLDPINLISVSQIYWEVKKNASPEEIARIRDEALKIRQMIVDQKISFEEAAKKYSNCPSGKNGGVLAPFHQGQMIKEFENTSFALKTGEISRIIRTELGFHIIRRNSDPVL